MELDPVGVVRNALESAGYNLEQYWYAWGTTAPKMIGKRVDFHRELLSQLSDIIKTKAGVNVNPDSLLLKIIGTGTQLEQKLSKQPSNNIEKIDLVLELMYEIYKKEGYLSGIKTDPITYGEIKAEMIDRCRDYLIEQGVIHINSREMFNLYSQTCFLISQARNDFIGFVELNKLIWTLETSEKRGIYRIEGKLINKKGFYEIDTREYFCLRLIAMKYKNTNQFYAQKLIAELDSYYLNHKHIVSKSIPNKGTRLLDRHYEDLHLALVYSLILEQAGFDAKTLKSLDDLDFSIHHLYEMSELVLIELLSLHSEEAHWDLVHINNIEEFGREQAKIIYNRETIKDLIEMDKIITEEDLPEKFKSHFEDKDDIPQFINRVNFIKTHSEKEIFRELFKNFYQLHKDKAFWATHYLGDYNKISVNN